MEEGCRLDLWARP